MSQSPQPGSNQEAARRTWLLVSIRTWSHTLSLGRLGLQLGFQFDEQPFWDANHDERQLTETARLLSCSEDELLAAIRQYLGLSPPEVLLNGISAHPHVPQDRALAMAWRLGEVLAVEASSEDIWRPVAAPSPTREEPG